MSLSRESKSPPSAENRLPTPARLLLAAVRAVIPRAERDEVVGDLRAEYADRARRDGDPSALRWLGTQVLHSIPHAVRWRWRRSTSPHEAAANAFRPGSPMIRHWISDARYALRRLRARPGYLAVAVLTLALGIGGTAAIFGIARPLLFGALPYRDEATIGSFWFAGAWTEEEIVYLRGLFPGSAYPGFTRVAAHRPGDVTLREGDAPTRLIPGLTTTAELFDVLGAPPHIGRTFREGDDVRGGEAVVVISHSLWQELGGTRDVIGRRLTLDGIPRTVVGVMPRGFWFPRPDVRIWVAQQLDPEGRNGSYELIGRVPPGTDMRAMPTQLAQITKALDDRFDFPAEWDLTKDPAITPMRERLLGPMRPAVVATLVAMALILLIACANVAALMLGQVEARETELAVRSALGADRRRLTQQLVVEALLIGMGAAVAGSALAVGGFGVLARSLPLGAWGESATFDWTLFVAALALAIGAVLIVTFVPATALWRGDLRGVLGSLRTGGIQGRGGRLERGLVVAEVLLAMLIAAGAALLVRSVSNLYAIDPGIETEGIAVVDVRSDATIPPAQRLQAIEEIARSFAAMPGVKGAAASLKIPLRGEGNSFGLEIPGRDNRAQPSTYFRVATAGYFETVGMRVLEGRGFDLSDRPDTAEIATVVNEEFVKRFFPGESAVGKIVSGGFRQRQRIVGVVANVAEGNLTDEPKPTRYYLASQVPWWGGTATFVVRAERPSEAVALLDRGRAELERIAPSFAVEATTTMARVFDVAVGPARQVMYLLALLTSLALVLGAVGIYGVIAHFATRRKRDWAIQIALGLPTHQVVRRIVGEGAALVSVGIVAGGIGTLVLVRVLASFLYGVRPMDPIAFAGAGVVMLVTGIVAAFIPARRASRVAPAAVLRES